MPGGGPKYEAWEREGHSHLPEPDALLLDGRKARIDQVVAGRTRSLTVVLERLADTFNMAAVLRTCEAMGIQEVHVIEHPQMPFRPNGSVTQGCDKWLELFVYPDFTRCHAALKARGFEVRVSALQEGAQNLYSLGFSQKTALVFGNERQGVSSEVLALADGVFWIPMYGFVQSLNISAAASAAITRAVSWRVEHLGQNGDLSAEDAQALKARFQKLSVNQRGKLYEGISGLQRVK